MKRHWKNFLFILLLGFLFFEILVVFPNRLERGNQFDDKQKKMEALSKNSEQIMQKIHLIESQKGSRDWELFADKATGSQEKGDWDLEVMEVQFYNKNLAEFKVNGKSGKVEGHTKNMKISGDVVTKSFNGYIFKTQKIDYDSSGRKIFAPEFVQMEGPSDSQGGGLKLTGNKLYIDIETSEMNIESDVRASKNLNMQKDLQIQSDSARFNGHNHEALFKGNVKISYGPMVIKGPEALFVYEPGSHILKNVLVKGGVQAQDQTKFASSENILIDLMSQNMYFRGSPRLIQNDDELTGEEIVFLQGGKKVKIESEKK